jgi:hypothetical protein
MWNDRNGVILNTATDRSLVVLDEIGAAPPPMTIGSGLGGHRIPARTHPS